MRNGSTWLSFLALTTVVAGQDFSPFMPDSRKLFGTVPGYAHTFGIAFDSTTVEGGITTFHNYMNVRDTLTASSCLWWGGDHCYKQDQPTWAGRRIEADAAGVHTFFNRWEEPVTLQFSTVPGSQTLIYADDQEQFLLSYEGESEGSVLGLAENLRHWKVLHQDLGGQPINSALNDAPVLVGQTVGLISFFRIDSFPLVLQPVELVGQSEPPLGLHAITPAFLNDFQPGDEIQVHDYAYYNMGPPWQNEDIYRKWVILARTDSPTEVIYNCIVTVYNVDSATETTAPSTLTFSKADVIAAIPFDRYNGTQSWLGMRDYCGIPLWTYRTDNGPGLGYCEEENCWGPFDTNGPPPQGETIRVGGLGTFLSGTSLTAPEGYSTSIGVVYFKKNGVSCMDEVVLSTSDLGLAPGGVMVFPSPADESFNYRSSTAVTFLEALDSQGRSVALLPSAGSSGHVDTEGWPAGFYLLRFGLPDGNSVLRRLVVSR
ncbi:MAG: hypothetical protein KJZ58_09195 [Flavobacteriales bacterium]|nr:hypothetical protein [Flavobacteriales bacterium]